MKQMTKKPAGRTLLYSALLLLAVWAMWGLRTCSTDSPFVRSEQGKSGGDTLDIAIEYSPLSLYRYADTLGGFNYDVLRRIADLADIEIKFHPVSNFNSALQKLDDGSFDVVVADIPLTSEHADRYLFTEPSFLARQVLIQLRDSAGSLDVGNRLQLAGKRVCVSRGSSAGMRLRNLADEIGDTIYVEEDSINGNEQLFLLVASGKVPLAVVSETMAKRMSRKFPDVDLSTEISFTQFQSWILRRGDTELKQRLDSLIIEFKSTEEYKSLQERYL